MTSIEKLSIKGVRSFSPNVEQVIEFHKPLTLYAAGPPAHYSRDLPGQPRHREWTLASASEPGRG